MKFARCLLALVVMVSGRLCWGQFESVVNPATYQSPSGRFALRVDPTDMRGRGAAQYVMTENGRTIWSVTHPFTLCEAVVSDNGEVGGYAKRNLQEDSGAFAIVVLDFSGDVRRLDVHPGSTNDSANAATTAHVPGVHGVLIDTAHNRFIVRVLRDRGGETWRMYRLDATQSEPDIVVPAPLPGRGFVRMLAVEFIPETSLALVHWYVHEVRQQDATAGARFSLIDESSTEIWHLQVDGEYDGMGEDWNWWWSLVRPSVRQAEVEAGAFSIRSYRDAATIRFRVEPRKASANGWLVRQIDRTAGELPISPTESTPPQPATIRLPPSGAFTLGQPRDGSAGRGEARGARTPRLGRIESLVVAASGKVFALSERTARVHVFDTQGRELARLAPPRSANRTGPIAVQGENVFVADSRAACYLSLAASARRLPASRDHERNIDRWLFHPAGDRRWEIGSQSIRLVNANGSLLRAINKRPDGNWLQQTHAAAVSPDGSLAIIAGPLSVNDPAGLTLNLYSAEGDPLRTIALSWESVYARVAFNGKWAMTSEDNTVYLYDVTSDVVRRFDLLTADGLQAWWYPHISPNGTELWVRNAGSTTFLRYRLP